MSLQDDNNSPLSAELVQLGDRIRSAGFFTKERPTEIFGTGLVAAQFMESGDIWGSTFWVAGRDSRFFCISWGGLVWEILDFERFSDLSIIWLGASPSTLVPPKDLMPLDVLRPTHETEWFLHFADTYIPAQLEEIVAALSQHIQETGEIPFILDDISYRMSIGTLHRLKGMSDLSIVGDKSDFTVVAVVPSLARTYSLSKSCTIATDPPS